MSCSALRRKDTRKFDYAILPSESALNYADMLKSLKIRGLEQVLLFVSDGLVGLPDAVQNEFPRSRYQSCWVHLMRAVSRLVRPSDRKVVLMRLSVCTGRRMPHSQNKNCQPFSTRMEQSTSDFISFFRMSPASSRFTSFRRVSSRQSTRQTSLRTTTKDFVTRRSSRSNSQRGFAGTIRLHGLL